MNLRTDIDQVLQAWGVRFIQHRRDAIKAAKLKASGSLNEEWSTKQIKADIKFVASIIFEFNTYGRFLDMKKMNEKAQKPIVEFEEWIKEKGVSTFESKFRKKNPNFKGSQTQLINKIAWGIVRSKQKRKKHKRRRWLGNNQNTDIDELMDELSEIYSKHGIKNIKEALQKIA